jgi:hypothetical protein
MPLKRPSHTLLALGGEDVYMITRRMKTRRHLRSVRTSALSEEERRLELREAEARSAHGRVEPVVPEASPSPGDVGASPPVEARSGRAGVHDPH